MKSTQIIGKSSISLEKTVYFIGAASIVGEKEGQGPLQGRFDQIVRDPMFGCDTWEAAESTMQKETALLAIQKSGLHPEDIRMAFVGDLLAQGIASSFGIASLEIPYLGLYGACSTIAESLVFGAMTVSAGYADTVLCATSSHFASAEKEFRYPLGYGSQRPLSATWTVTGSGAFILSQSPPSHVQPQDQPSGFAKITGATIGKVVDFGLKDSMNMGGCMAPAACDTISRHLSDFSRTPDDYDKIITGDLGTVGKKLLLHLLEEKGISIKKQHEDCGLLIFDNKRQDTHSGGSGCGCSASVLASYLLPQVISGKWKRILFVPTGALLSKVSFNEGDSVPGIAHAVVIEASGRR